MSIFRKQLGEIGEMATKEEMENRGFRLLKKNFFIRGGELDLIMEKNGRIVFLEVKTRSGNEFGSPLESITKKKKDHLIHTAKVYLHQNNLDDADVAFWASAVYVDEKNKIKNLEIYEDIFI